MSFFVSFDFSLKSILLDIRIVTPACFLGPFDWNFFLSLYSEEMSVFEVEVCFLYAALGWIQFLYPIFSPLSIYK